MAATQLSICNKTGHEPPAGWEQELRKTLECTYSLLDGIEGQGHPYKRVSCVVFDDCEDPYWDGQSETEGHVHMDPSKHDARAIAHEVGHGLEERWRKKTSEVMGQSMAEAVRFFVEQDMGDTTWTPRADWCVVLDACERDKAKLIQLLDGNELHAKY